MKNYYKALLIKRYKNNDLIFENLNISFKDSLKELYKNLNCEVIDIQERKIKSKIYDFIFDDEFLNNGKTKKPENITAFSEKDNKIIEILFSNIIICGQADKNGNETDLNEEDINNILNSLVYIQNKTNKEYYKVLKYEI